MTKEKEQSTTIPETWHIWASSLQKPLATLSCTLLEKLIHAHRLTVIPFIIFCTLRTEQLQGEAVQASKVHKTTSRPIKRDKKKHHASLNESVVKTSYFTSTNFHWLTWKTFFVFIIVAIKLWRNCPCCIQLIINEDEYYRGAKIPCSSYSIDQLGANNPSLFQFRDISTAYTCHYTGIIWAPCTSYAM